MKRFTETTKWDDPWFRKLPPAAKLLWIMMCDKCDHAGVIEPDWEAMSFHIGLKVTESDLKHFVGRIDKIGRDKFHIRKFVSYQYGKLSPNCKPHAPVYAALSRHGLNHDEVEQNSAFKETVDAAMRRKIINRDGLHCIYFDHPILEGDAVIDHIIPRVKGGRATPDNLVVCSAKANSQKWDYTLERFCDEAGLDHEQVKDRLSKATSKPIEGYQGTLKEKEEEKDTDKDQEKEADLFSANNEPPHNPIPESVRRACVNLGRRFDTQWPDKDVIAYRKLKLTEEDAVRDIELFTSTRKAGWEFYRKDISTLLNNWQIEIERCEDFMRKSKSSSSVPGLHVKKGQC